MGTATADKLPVGKNPPSKLSPEFGPWLRRARAGLRLGVGEFAERANLSPTTVSAFELNRKLEGSFSVEVFNRIANGLGMELAYVLHKAGLLGDRDGINIGLLHKVEAAAEAFGEHEHEIRSAVAEAMAALDRPGSVDRAEMQRLNALIGNLGRALGALDLVTERLRAVGMGGRRAAPDEVQYKNPRPWSAEERQFLANNPHLSHEEAARTLGRTPDSIRNYRRYRLTNEGGVTE